MAHNVLAADADLGAARARERRRAAARELEELFARIRELDGFASFALPPR